MSIWTRFDDAELEEILDCENLEEVKRRITRRFDQSQWVAAARTTYQLVRRKTLSLASVFNSINQAGAFSVLVLLAVIGSITVAFTPLTIMTGVLSVVGMASGIFLTVIAALQHKQKVEEKINKLDFNAIQILCADELLTRKRMQLASYKHHHNMPVLMPVNRHLADAHFHFESRKKLENVRRGVVFGLIAFASLFATYYCGLAIAFNAFGLVAVSGAMLGPIGMGVALAVAIGIGIYFGIRHYQARVRKEHTAQFIEFQEQQIKDKSREYRTLAKQAKHLAPQLTTARYNASLPLLHERDALCNESENEIQADRLLCKKI